jgi:hypothetical protein
MSKSSVGRAALLALFLAIHASPILAASPSGGSTALSQDSQATLGELDKLLKEDIDNTRNTCASGQAPDWVAAKRARYGATERFADASDMCVATLGSIAHDRHLLAFYRDLLAAIGGDAGTYAAFPQAIGAAVLGKTEKVAIGNGKVAVVPPCPCLRCRVHRGLSAGCPQQGNGKRRKTQGTCGSLPRPAPGRRDLLLRGVCLRRAGFCAGRALTRGCRVPRYLSGRLAAEQRCQITAVMRHAQNLHVRADNAIHDHIIARGKASPATAQIIVARSSQAGMTGKQIKPVGDGIDLTVGNRLAAALFGDVLPDLVQVGGGLFVRGDAPSAGVLSFRGKLRAPVTLYVLGQRLHRFLRDGNPFSAIERGLRFIQAGKKPRAQQLAFLP